MPAEIIEAHKLYEEYKLDLALQSLNKLSQGQIEELPIEIQLHFHTFMGKILFIMSNYEDALTSAEKSYEIASRFEQFHDSIDKIDAYLLLSETLMRNGKYEKSAEILKEADKMIHNLPDKLDKLKKERRAESLSIQDWLGDKTGKLLPIEKMHEELLEIYSELGDLDNLARIYSFRSGYFWFTGDMDEALNNLSKSNEVLSKFEVSPFFRFVEAVNLNLFGMISFARGDLFKAIKYYNEGFILAKKYNILSTFSSLLNNLGEA